MFKVLTNGCETTRGSKYSAAVDLFLSEKVESIQSNVFGGLAVKVSGYENKYAVNEHGYIFSFSKKGTVKTVRKLKQKTRRDGYKSVVLYKHGSKKDMSVHRIVMLSFEKYKSLCKNVVNHINNMRDDNRLENLEWTTHAGNARHRDLQGRGFDLSNFNRNTKRKLKETEIKEIINLLQDGRIMQKDIAKKYGVSKQTITNIKQGNTYGELI